MSWRSQQPAKPAAPKPKFDSNDDDWETDPTYEVLFFVKKKFANIFFNRINQLKNPNDMVQQVYQVLVE